MRRAIITTRHQNSFFFHMWERYYAPLFDEVKVIPVTYKPHMMLPGAKIQNMLINEAVDKMIETFDLLCVVDMDEFIAPDPEKYAGLGDYLDRFEMDAARCTGYHVTQADDDPLFDLSKPITAQRALWIRDTNYDKTVVTRRKLVYSMGGHFASPEAQHDPDLIMFHLRDADIYRSLARFGSEKDKGAWDAFRKRREGAEPIPAKWKII